jgi:uncharacterized protein involved in exopolysaccharide biosynthesis
MSGTENSPRAPKRRSKWRWLLWLLVGVASGGALYVREPRIYESQTNVMIIPQRVPERMVQPVVTVPLAERLDMIAQQILSRTQLQGIIQEFNLYEAERKVTIMEDVIEQMRYDVAIRIARPREPDADVRTFSVSFKSDDARTAMRVTERLGSMFVQQNLEDRQLFADQTNQFLRLNVEEVARRLLESDHRLRDAKQRGLAVAPSIEVAEHEVLVETYKQLVRHSEAAKLAVDLERRQIGEQFRIIDGARLPERPISPRLFPYLALGALAGLVAGIVFSIGASLLRRARTPPRRAAA